MKKRILILAVWLLRVVYMPIKQFKVKDKITLISRQSDEVPADFLLIGNYFSNTRPNVKVVILARKLDARSLRIIMYPAHMLRQMYHISTSKLVLLDGYCIVASVVEHKAETKIVQMWHASAAIKKFGWQIVGKPSGSDIDTATIMKMHANYDYILAPSRITGEIYQQAFRTPGNKIRFLGLPHLSLLQKNNQSHHAEIRKAFGIDSTKKVILYVPTFRNGQCVDLDSLIRVMDFNQYEFVARVHPIDKLPTSDARVIYANKYSTTEWMELADYIITDYSSLMMEAAILKKPLYLYVYDIEEYIEDPGLNMNFSEEAILPMVFKNAEQLLEKLEQPYPFDLLGQFLSKYIEIDCESSLHTLGLFLENLLDGVANDEEKN